MKRSQILTAFLMACAYGACAASPHTEMFDSTTAGWQDRDAAEMTVTNDLAAGNPGGCLRGSFAASGGPPPTELDAFAATGALATANFIGDFQAAQIDLIGLDFRAEQVLPSEVLVRLIGNSTTFFRSIKPGIVATGTWYSFAISLDSLSAGGWSGGSADQFKAAMTNITALEIQITRAGTPLQNYFVDNVYVASLPEATAEAVGGDNVQITWSNLRSNEAYRAEASSAPDQSWSLLESFTATGAVQVITDTNAALQRAYRLLID